MEAVLRGIGRVALACLVGGGQSLEYEVRSSVAGIDI